MPYQTDQSATLTGRITSAEKFTILGVPLDADCATAPIIPEQQHNPPIRSWKNRFTSNGFSTDYLSRYVR